MPERKRFFFIDLFPKQPISNSTARGWDLPDWWKRAPWEQPPNVNWPGAKTGLGWDGEKGWEWKKKERNNWNNLLECFYPTATLTRAHRQTDGHFLNFQLFTFPQVPHQARGPYLGHLSLIGVILSISQNLGLDLVTSCCCEYLLRHAHLTVDQLFVRIRLIVVTGQCK